MDLKEFVSAPKAPRQEKTIVGIAELFREIGLDAKEVSPAIIARLELLQEVSQFLSDEYHDINLAKKLFEYYDVESPDWAFSDIEKRTVLIGTLFTDIGKTGPRNATPEQQRIIADVFSIENVDNPRMSLEKLVRQQFPDEAETKLQELETLGLNTAMPMRDFWNKHAEWTYDIVRGDGVPPEAVAAAATHQLLEGINPGHIVAEDGSFTEDFGTNTRFDKIEKLIIILDKYDAFRRRLGVAHDEAIEMLRKLIGKTAYANDREFARLIADIEDVLA